MDLHQIMYMFEHRVLPQFFFAEREKFVGILLEDNGILYQIFNDISEKEQTENPYSPEQFGVKPAKITEEVMMLKLIFPEPEEEPLCYCSYLFFDREFKKLGFFCIEKGNDKEGAQPFVCSWSPEGVHFNYGHCTFEKQEDLLRCADIFMKQEYDMEREKES